MSVLLVRQHGMVPFILVLPLFVVYLPMFGIHGSIVREDMASKAVVRERVHGTPVFKMLLQIVASCVSPYAMTLARSSTSRWCRNRGLMRSTKSFLTQ